MPVFGKTSLDRLHTCHPDLVRVLNLAIKDCPVDFGIACGFRGKADQDEACRKGLSKTPWAKSKHNTVPSVAVDVLPWIDGVNAWVWIEQQKAKGTPAAEIDRRVYQAFRAVRNHVWPIAQSLGVKLRWGGDWDGDGKSRFDGDADEKFVDLPHFELMGV